MTQWSQPVFSSMCNEIGYDDDKQEMIVTWKDGRKSAYSGVSEELATQCSKAPSVGNFLNSEVKPNYPHRYI